jgi:AMP nucleosidase
VSDKPLHGEIKLPGEANAFYERAISPLPLTASH